MTRRPPTRVYRVADLVADLAAQQAGEAADPPVETADAPVPPPAESPPVGPAADRPQETARPTIAAEPAILGLSRRARSKVGARLFVWFFVFVYAVILIQLVVALWQDARSP